jgi:hypothetical protein
MRRIKDQGVAPLPDVPSNGRMNGELLEHRRAGEDHGVSRASKVLIMMKESNPEFSGAAAGDKQVVNILIGGAAGASS